MRHINTNKTSSAPTPASNKLVVVSMRHLPFSLGYAPGSFSAGPLASSHRRTPGSFAPLGTRHDWRYSRVDSGADLRRNEFTKAVNVRAAVIAASQISVQLRQFCLTVHSANPSRA